MTSRKVSNTSSFNSRKHAQSASNNQTTSHHIVTSNHSPYFVSHPALLDVKPDFQERAQKNNADLSFANNPIAIKTHFKTRGPIKGGLPHPPAGVTLGVDPICEMFDFSQEENNDFFNDQNEDLPTNIEHPEWLNQLKNKLLSWLQKDAQIPMMFHLPAEFDDSIGAMVSELCNTLNLPCILAKGSAEDPSYAFSSIRNFKTFLTCLTAPDSLHLRSGWTYARDGSVWLWISPLAPDWLTSSHYTTLPFDAPEFKSIISKDMITLADPVALQRQINGFKTAQGEHLKYEYLRGLAKPKKLLIANEKHFHQIKLLQAKLPQFHSLLQTLACRIFLQAAAEKPLYLGQLLLAGAPGNGKTWLCEQIATALEIPFLSIQLAGNSDIMILRGSQRQWSNADAGRPVKFIAECPIANPLIMIDEIDKTGGSQHGDLLHTLLMLLEPENSCRFMDNFVEAPINMRHISYVLTANDLSQMGPHLTTRLEITTVLPPSPDEMQMLAQNLFEQKLSSLGVATHFEIQLQELELQQLTQDCSNVRTLKQRINRAIENALTDVPDLCTFRSYTNHLRIKPDLPKKPALTGIGFIRN